MRRLIAACRDAVVDSCGDAVSYAFLTGSFAQGAAHRGSDIDITVVLKDDVPKARVRDLRSAFEYAYLELHEAFTRPPDLEWPGEVLYDAEAMEALQSSGLLFTDGVLNIAPHDAPFRFWLSMHAVCVPLIAGDKCAQRAATACRELARWRIWSLTEGGDWKFNAQEFIEDSSWESAWGLRQDRATVRQALLGGLEAVISDLLRSRTAVHIETVAPDRILRHELMGWAASHCRGRAAARLESEVLATVSPLGSRQRY